MVVLKPRSSLWAMMSLKLFFRIWSVSASMARMVPRACTWSATALGMVPPLIMPQPNTAGLNGLVRLATM
ncbi:hypothetical protein D3C72_1420520 [compost metagenome]